MKRRVHHRSTYRFVDEWVWSRGCDSVVLFLSLFLQSQQSELLDLLGGDVTSTAPVLTSEAPPTVTPSGGGALLDLLGLDVGAQTSAPPPSSSIGLMDLLGGVPTSTPAAPAPTGESDTISRQVLTST